VKDETVNETDEMEHTCLNDDYEVKETEEVEVEHFEFWLKRQRDLITSVVDYNLSSLSDLITNGDINLSPRYQRRFRWDEKRQSKLIESFLMNVPIPPIFLNEDEYGQYSIIDGKQRLSAIHNFLRGRLTLKGLEVFADLNGMNFDQIPTRLQTVLKTRVTVRGIIILRQSDREIKFEVFRRINTGGVNLNNQEIRNSVYPGSLNDLLLDLSEEKKFHKMLGVNNKQRSKLYQEMRDVEFVLRYFTFRDTWDGFSGGMRRNLDEYMLKNQKLQSDQINELKKDFLNTLDIVEAAFGENAFRRWNPENHQWKQQVLASLYDAQMFACRNFSVEEVAPHSPDIIQGLKDLFSDDVFRNAIDSATNTPSYFKTRIQMMSDLIHRVVEE